ncbi:MAG: FtsX-like permease family protein, partial [Arenimonas sp.]
VNQQRLAVLDQTHALARFPPRPLLYMTLGTARALLPQEPNLVTFVLVRAAPGQAPQALAERIARRTGLRARTAVDFEADTVRWFLVNSEDVGDIAAMLTLAMTMGLGMSGVMLYMFALGNQHQYAVFKALGAEPRTLVRMVLVQAATCAGLGVGIGLGLCGLAGIGVRTLGFPFRMLWFTPLLGAIAVVIVTAIAALLSLRPVLQADPAEVFSAR